MIGRVFRMVRTPVTLMVLLGILCYGAWWGWRNVIATVPEPQAAPCVKQAVPKGQLKSNQVTIAVYNGGDRLGLAGDVGRALRQRGFRVKATGNTKVKVEETVIVGAGAKNPEVLMVKAFFKEAVVKVERERADRSVDVLVGNGYGGFNKNAKTTYAIKATTICLPSQAKSTAPVGG